MTTLDQWLARSMTGAVPAGIALMGMIRDAKDRTTLDAFLLRHRHDAPALHALWAAHPDAWERVRAVAASVDHSADAIDPAEAVARVAAGFDRAERVSRAGSVALYSLGDPALLAAATAEVVALLDGWGLLDPTVRVLDLGCGIGRFAAALAPAVASVVGLDVSANMVEAARRACAQVRNVEIRRGSGLALDGVPDGSIDLLLAVDSFPYVVQAGGDLAARHVAEAARVLAPGGTAAIFNYSYRGDVARDRADLDALAARAGLVLAPRKHLGLRHWDAEAFVLTTGPA